MSKTRYPAFTLAELLITLAILGMIATFTIPKIISTTQNGQSNAKAKEALSTVSAAYQMWLNSGQVSSSTRLSDFTQYLNYTKIMTSGTIDDTNDFGSLTCSAGQPCYKLHNGGVLMDRCSFGGTSTTHVLFIMFDPDGEYSNSNTGPGKSLAIHVFYNGRVTDRGSVPFTVQSSCDTYTPAPASETPSWFSW
ncbi:MAG: hypothetical protein K0Q50_181 [Vampirovibrio sp.]|jgi:prepilin-type N-terminal cleavage/methylation domain-containing protein|nr:hypothetical protein [Vampirovibrio sp.]